MQFDQYLSQYPKISESTKNAYKQDLHDFFTLLKYKNKTVAHLEASDIEDYITEIIRKTVSYAYGIRKIAALKLVIKFIKDRYSRDLTHQISKIAIARFPVFCTDAYIKTVFEQYQYASNQKDLRDKLILVLLYRYGLSVTKLTLALYDKTPTHSYSARIRFYDQSEPVDLTSEDHNLLIAYMKSQEESSLSSEKKYIFSVHYRSTIKPISANALWSIIKKLCAPLRELPVAYGRYEQESVTNEPYRFVYAQRHPRS